MANRSHSNETGQGPSYFGEKQLPLPEEVASSTTKCMRESTLMRTTGVRDWEFPFHPTLFLGGVFLFLQTRISPPRIYDWIVQTEGGQSKEEKISDKRCHQRSRSESDFLPFLNIHMPALGPGGGQS